MNYLYLYAGVFLVILLIYSRRHVRKEAEVKAELTHAIENGLTEPPSLHPVIDPALCIGSGSCVAVCPEGALGVVKGKAVLINAAHCIGHGACQPACPFDAIKLVFGTEKRGIDIPNVSPGFETNVKGIFIAGELGGMGLIRKAAQQGREAIASVRKRIGQAGSGVDGVLDVVIVGCGPAGLSAGLSSMHHKLRYHLIEQEDSLGGAVYQYPRQKIAMTAPVVLDIIGSVKFGEVQKEKLLEFWNGVVQKTGLKISFRERMEGIEKVGAHFEVVTNRGRYPTRTVLLAMGRRGTPRKLGVPGEDSPKVAYSLIDPAQYKGQSVLVVGGGDSALEAALAVAAQPNTPPVVLSYRSAAFSRVKQKNREALAEAEKAGRIQVLLGSEVREIGPDTVQIAQADTLRQVRNDIVIVCAGGLLPTPLLQKAGIQFETKYGTE